VEHKSKKEDIVISKEEEEDLAGVSSKMCKLYSTPVPLSWNNLGNIKNHENPGY